MAKREISRRDFLKGMAAGAVGVASAGVLSGCDYRFLGTPDPDLEAKKAAANAAKDAIAAAAASDYLEFIGNHADGIQKIQNESGNDYRSNNLAGKLAVNDFTAVLSCTLDLPVLRVFHAVIGIDQIIAVLYTLDHVFYLAGAW